MTPILQQHARRILACSNKSSSFRFYATLWSPKGNQTLQSRIKAALDQKAQLIPVLDPWSNISGLIRNLPDSNRFSQALQALKWVVFAKDYAARLHLIEIVLGLDKAEKFFQSIPAGMRDYSVYSTLVTSYKRFEVTLSKAESTLKKMRELGFLSKPSSSIMSLYSQLEKRNMVDKILYEMEENKVKPDNVTANHTLNVYTAISYVKAMEIFMRMWVDKVGNLVEIAKTYVRVCSEMYGNVARSARQVMHTLWDEFKSSLSKLGDVDGAEDTYGEWKEIEHDVRELVTQKSMMLLHVLNLLLLLVSLSLPLFVCPPYLSLPLVFLSVILTHISITRLLRFNFCPKKNNSLSKTMKRCLLCSSLYMKWEKKKIFAGKPITLQMIYLLLFSDYVAILAITFTKLRPSLLYTIKSD